METKIEGNKLSIFLDRELYSKEVLSKCFYWYGGVYDVSVKISDATRYCVTLLPIQDNEEEPYNFQQLISNISRSLSDYQLRDIVNQETQHIRNLLVAKAFAYYEEEDEDPGTEISDPVGFDPLSL